ncbi:TPA: transposase [Streptococcus pyogenes]
MENNIWIQLSIYFIYPEEIRKLIYTTNSKESLNKQIRKVTKTKTIFPSYYTLKNLYLAMIVASRK